MNYSNFSRKELIEASKSERLHHAKIIRQVRKLLLKGNEPQDQEPLCTCSICELADNSPAGSDTLFSASALLLCLLVAGLMLIGSCKTAHAEEVIDGYKVSDYVKAIYLAEGGPKAKYQFGIRSVHYSSFAEAKAICQRTVLHRYHLYIRYAHRHYPRYLEYLQSAYCPTSGRNLTESERRLNQYWVKNVSYFLRNS